MSSKISNKCNCPLCGKTVSVSADGTTVDEKLAQGIISVFKEMQNKTDKGDYDDCLLPCPRCGNYRMIPGVSRNALSRHADIYVCSICGVDEAVRVFAESIMPITSWWAVTEILGQLNGVQSVPIKKIDKSVSMVMP